MKEVTRPDQDKKSIRTGFWSSITGFLRQSESAPVYPAQEDAAQMYRLRNVRITEDMLREREGILNGTKTTARHLSQAERRDYASTKVGQWMYETGPSAIDHLGVLIDDEQIFLSEGLQQELQTAGLTLDNIPGEAPPVKAKIIGRVLEDQFPQYSRVVTIPDLDSWTRTERAKITGVLS